MFKQKKRFLFLALIPLLIFLSAQKGTKVKKRLLPVTVTKSKLLGTLPEPICDSVYWKGKLYLAPYLTYKKCKIYVINTSSGEFSAISPFDQIVESVYRLWVNPNSDCLYLQTEQPPLFYQSNNGEKWKLVEKYADEGWGVLGCTTSNGKIFRGYSYRNMDTVIKVYDNNEWINFPSLGKKIVWTIEYLNGYYYAGTSPTAGYKNSYIGNIYMYDGKKTWTPVKGYEVGDKIGGAICSLATEDGLFFGTGNPQTILLLNNGMWKRYHFFDKHEISKIWRDSYGRVFTGTVTGEKMMIRQWTGNNWVDIFKIDARPGRWDVLGNVAGQNMYIIYRDRNYTKILLLRYQ